MNSYWKCESTAAASTGRSSTSLATGDSRHSSQSKSSASSSSKKSAPTAECELLQPEDVVACLRNMLFPRGCDSLNLLGQNVKPLSGYPDAFELKAIYSLLVEKQVAQFKASMLVKRRPLSVEGRRLFGRELAFYRHVEPQIRHLMVQTMTSPVPRGFLSRGQCEFPKHRNPALPFHKGPPEPGCDATCPPVLVLQDFAVDGFQHARLQSEMDFRHCSAALRALACLHATSAVVDRSDAKLKRGSYLKTSFPFLLPTRYECTIFYRLWSHQIHIFRLQNRVKVVNRNF